MWAEDLEKTFLVIGTGSRKKAIEAALAGGATKSPFLGEKGIGRLSAMRLGDHLRVETAKQSDPALNFLVINWKDFNNVDAMLDDIPVTPTIGGAKPSEAWSGTSIIISDLMENWTEARVRDMAGKDLARLTRSFADAGGRPRIALFSNNDNRIPIATMQRDVGETGNFAGVKRRAGAAWGGTPKERGDQAFELRAHPISELAIDVRGPDLHQHVRALDRPAHLLAFGHALADNRIHGKFREGGSDS